jgi:hypothetical protein
MGNTKSVFTEYFHTKIYEPLLDKQNQFLVMCHSTNFSHQKIKAGFASNRIFSANHCKLIPFSEHCDGMGILTGLVGFSNEKTLLALASLVLEFR